MKIKFTTMLVVIAATFISTELTAWSQQSPPHKITLGTIFRNIVGRDATPQELTFWKNVERNNEIKGLSVKIDAQIMDWFVAPAQAGERLVAIEDAYNFYFKRSAHAGERAQAEELVRSKRIASADIRLLIGVDLALLKVADVPGDLKAINVTVSNLSTISTSRAGSVGLIIFKEANCHPWNYDDELAVPLTTVGVPPIAPQQSITVKVSSTKVLQRANSQRGAYSVYANAKGENYEIYFQDGKGHEGYQSSVNNYQCIPGIAFGKDKVIGQQPYIPLPKNQPPPTHAPPTPKNP